MTGKLIRIDELYTPELCQANRDKLYVFGDNMIGAGDAGQACIRSEPNTIGIPTKWAPAMSESAFFTNDDWTQFSGPQREIRHRFLHIQTMLKLGRDVVIHKNGIGTGLAQLERRAPIIFKFINECIADLEHEYPAVS